MKLPTVKKSTMLILRTDGTEEVVKGTTIPLICKAIQATTLDFVRIGRLQGSDLTMAVNDSGYRTKTVDHGGGQFELKPIEALLPINQKATELYHAICIPGTTYQIVGDVAIFHDEEST